jgi:hypothetical protein
MGTPGFWILHYLDERYKNITRHQGLTCFAGDSPQFHKAIEEYFQRNHLCELVDIDGTMTIVPGINFMPWARLCIPDFFLFRTGSFFGIRRIPWILSDSAEHTSELNLPGQD